MRGPPMLYPRFARASLCLLALLGFAESQAQLRIACWNITNGRGTTLVGSRATAFQTSIFGVFQGRSMSPDVILIQEMFDSSGLIAFVNLLNSAPGSPGDWAAYPWPTGVSLPDSQSVTVYRTSKVIPAGPVVVVAGGGLSPLPPRNTYRFDFYPSGYVNQQSLISAYNVHWKAGSAGSDESRRLAEAQIIRQDANSLSPRGGIIVAGDFNISSSSAGSYNEIIGNKLDNTGRVFDPINSPGSWGDNHVYEFIHTQDPWTSDPNSTNVGMDDRYDFIMMSQELLDGDGLHYIGNSNLAYSTTTWNDPNHSYRSWGNDGGSWTFASGSWRSQAIRVNGNTMVGPTIAQALINSTGNQTGHLPIFADLRVPPVAGTNTLSLDFGVVGPNTPVSVPIAINNVPDLNKWGLDGVADLRYSFNTSGTFFGPNGIFTDRADDGAQVHSLTVNAASVGRINGTVTITTNDPARPTITIQCTALVTGQIIRPNNPPRP